MIPNGVDLKKFNNNQKKYDHSLKSPIILYVGELCDWKNPDKTIRAVANTQNLSLLMVGNGEEKYIEMGKKLLGDRFHHAKVKYEQMTEIYASADIFTLCSAKNREAFGLVYLEAMASGLPVVATEDSTRRYVVGDAGIFVQNPNDANEYSSKLQLVLNKNWSDLPQTQAQKFDWDEIVKEYERTFEGLIK